VKPVNRTFAAQDNAVQHVDVGALKDVPADAILHSVNADEDASHAPPQHAPNKKERRILKHELFIERLEASRAPYSKSHARRLKRREKEELTAGGLGSLKAALPSIAPTTRTTAATTIGGSSAGQMDAAATTNTTTATAAAIIDDASVKPINNELKSKSKQPTDQLEMPPPPPTPRPGQIGESHDAPLMRSQRRRRALKAERFRQPLIRSNPEFAANPFETIRTHARNTLVSHHRPTTT